MSEFTEDFATLDHMTQSEYGNHAQVSEIVGGINDINAINQAAGGDRSETPDRVKLRNLHWGLADDGLPFGVQQIKKAACLIFKICCLCKCQID